MAGGWWVGGTCHPLGAPVGAQIEFQLSEMGQRGQPRQPREETLLVSRAKGVVDALAAVVGAAVHPRVDHEFEPHELLQRQDGGDDAGQRGACAVPAERAQRRA